MQSPSSSRAPAGILCNGIFSRTPRILNRFPGGRAGNKHVEAISQVDDTLGYVRKMSRRGHRSCRRAHCGSCAHQGGGRRAGSSSQASAIPSATAHPATIHPVLTISGIIAPYQNVTLSNNLSEPAAAVYVNEGDHVRRGDVLAILDTSDLQAQYEAAVDTAGFDDSKAQQSVYSAQQTIEQAPQNVATAREAYNQFGKRRILSLKRRPISPAIRRSNRRDTSRRKHYRRSRRSRTSTPPIRGRTGLVPNEAIIAEKTNGTMASGLQASQIASAREDAASARAQAQQIAAQISRATIRFPVDGIVVNRNLNPGEYPGTRTIFVLQQVDPVYAELNASSADIFKIRTGAVAASRDSRRAERRFPRHGGGRARSGAARFDELHSEGPGARHARAIGCGFAGDRNRQSPERVGNLDSNHVVPRRFAFERHDRRRRHRDAGAREGSCRRRDHLDRHRSAQRNARHHQRPALDHAGRRPRHGSLSVWIARVFVELADARHGHAGSDRARRHRLVPDAGQSAVPEHRLPDHSSASELSGRGRQAKFAM